MKILWLNINASYSHSSLALPSLHSQVEERLRGQFDWCVVSGTINRDPDIPLLEIINYNPDIILSTVWLFNHKYLIDLLSKVSKLMPNVRVVLGGPEFLGDNSEFLSQNKFVNAVFRGEGEESFPSILESFISDRDIENIPGICMLSPEGKYIDNGTAIISDFATINPPESSYFFDWGKPFVQIETSRGCFNRCTFCVSGNIRKVEEISYENLRNRLNEISKIGIKEVRILDRTFNANTAHAINLLNIFSGYYPEICFHLEIHPAFINDKLKLTLEKLPAGLLFLETGIQSLDELVLSTCKREGNSKESFKGLKYLCNLKKFVVHADLIAGLPYYTYDALISNLISLINIDINEIQLEKLKLLPGTELRKNASIFGIIYSLTPPYEVLETSSISFEDLYKCSQLSKIIDIWHNSEVWHVVFREAVIRYPEFIEFFLSYCMKTGVLDSPMSLEKKGLILYRFCKQDFKDIVPMLAQAWESSGLSHNKGPGKYSKENIN